MTLKRRVGRLETRLVPSRPALDMIVISMVAPSADGPVHLGPYSARILIGNNAGAELVRGEDESAEAFSARCDALLR